MSLLVALLLLIIPTLNAFGFPNCEHRVKEIRLFPNRRDALVAIAWTTFPAHALTPQEASQNYDVYAAGYDSLDGGSTASMLGIDKARNQLISQAYGDVLEIGVGTGLNLGSYIGSNLKSLTAVDVSAGMLEQAKRRASALDFPETRFVQADATSQLVELFGEHSFDTVVDTFSLCVMGTDGAKSCLKQLSKVVKPKLQGGKILLIENSRSSNPLLGLYQDSTAEAAASAGGKGCVYNQDVRSMIEQVGGMTIESEELYAAGLFRSFRCSVGS